MRMSPPATWQILLTDPPERLGHVTRGTAGIAFHPKILGLKRRAAFVEAQCPYAIAGATVDEPLPREVIQVPILASQKETCRNGIGILRRLIPLRSSTTLVNETCRLWAVPTFLELEQTTVIGRQQPTLHTTQPAGERTNRHTNIGFCRKRLD
ncbi:hypothetical protein D3C84_486740 [compost metagenome]